MSRFERYSTRSLVYSKWHRLYLGNQEPMIDLDGIEYCQRCSKALALIETARDVGQPHKATSVLRSLAESANGILALCLLYTVSEDADDQTGCSCEPPRFVRESCDHGIARFRVRKVWPKPTNDLWQVMTPEELRARLRVLRMNHLEADHTPWEVA